jgi:hypothetical protein
MSKFNVMAKKENNSEIKQISFIYDIMIENGVPENLAKFRFKMYENILNNSLNKNELLECLIITLKESKTNSFSVGYTMSIARNKLQKLNLK